MARRAVRVRSRALPKRGPSLRVRGRLANGAVMNNLIQRGAPLVSVINSDGDLIKNSDGDQIVT